MKKDYVILISPAEPRSYLGLESDEDEASTIPPRTRDIDLALRFEKFSDARAAVRDAVKRYPAHVFRVDVAPRPIEVESIGEDVYIVISRGHHDIHEFMRAVRADGYDWPLGVPTHIWMKTRPSRDPGYTCFYDVVPRGTRGAWPATHVQEAWGDASYEANFPASAPAQQQEGRV